MKRTAACLAGLLMLVLLAGCKGGADESGARENKGDIETSGTVSVLYAANDGLYLIRFLRNGAEDADAAVRGWQKERTFLPPYFLRMGERPAICVRMVSMDAVLKRGKKNCF